MTQSTPLTVAVVGATGVVGRTMGVKAAGGVRDLHGLSEMVSAGASRIGASAGVRIVSESRGTAAAAPGRDY